METPELHLMSLAEIPAGSCILDSDSDGNFVAVSLAPDGDSLAYVRLTGPADKIGWITVIAKGLRPTVAVLGDAELDFNHDTLGGILPIGRAEKQGLLKLGRLILWGEHARILVRNNDRTLLAASLKDGSLINVANQLDEMICIISDWRLVRRVGNELRVVHSFPGAAANA
jgi:hypothetical protein